MTPFDPNNLPSLDDTPRSGITPARQILALHHKAERDTPLSVATGILLLWHDHWDKAHEIAQSNEGERDHDLLHGILHRREGDFGNANYWFRSAGLHPCYSLIATRLAAIHGEHPSRDQFVVEGLWKPAAFVDAVRNRKTIADDEFLRKVQAVELTTFFEWVETKR